MFDLAEELDSIRNILSERGIEFAVCGGMAMAIHGFTRATEDLDLFVRPEDISAIEECVAALGYVIKAHPMNFSGGAMKIRRVSKIDRTDGDTLTLDLLLVTPETAEVWETRTILSWRGGPFPVVSREGLIALKRYRSSEQDLVDIGRLQSDE
ncbi:MAG TPA: nucleotidyl transferase AbiEii/AbiGii toxin family protein [Thermoanaerobaculia bacterium]